MASLVTLDRDDPALAPQARSTSLATARALLHPPTVAAASPWPALGSAFLAACAALGAAAAVILGAPTLGAPSKAVTPPVAHIVGG